MTSRERFEAWVGAEWIAFHEQPSEGMAIRKVFRLDPYDVWQAAEAQAVKRCAEIVDCGCDCRDAVLAALATPSGWKAEWQCTSLSVSCHAILAADIRAELSVVFK